MPLHTQRCAAVGLGSCALRCGFSHVMAMSKPTAVIAVREAARKRSTSTALAETRLAAARILT